MTITLRDVNHDNWEDVIGLEVASDQREFVAPNIYSLLEANYSGPYYDCFPHAIYEGDTPVGFVMYAYFTFEGRRVWGIWRFMIAEQHQRKGYGRAALQLTIEQMRKKHQCREILISFVPENIGAKTLYMQAGFANTGKMHDGEIVYQLDLTNA
jgi:diamine N-acetyltransferase